MPIIMDGGSIWIVDYIELNIGTKILKITFNCNSNDLEWSWKANDLEDHFCIDLQSLKRVKKDTKNKKMIKICMQNLQTSRKSYTWLLREKMVIPPLAEVPLAKANQAQPNSWMGLKHNLIQQHAHIHNWLTQKMLKWHITCTYEIVQII